MAAKIGDTVRFLNDVGGGVVVKIKDNMAYVADEDGFETPMLLRECVVVAESQSQQSKKAETPVVGARPAPTPATPSKAADKPKVVEDEQPEEVAGGNVMNVVLAFEAHDLKQLSKSGFDAYLVNDSNYYLYFTFMTRADHSNQWTTRYAGVIEPNFQLLVAELSVEDLPKIDRVAVQYVAFKRDRAFDLKAPVAYESRLDTTKFAKLHCFRENIYFEVPVIALDIVLNDEPQRGALKITTELLEQGSVKKDERSKSRPVKRHSSISSSKAQKNTDPLVIDLHIDELLDSHSGMSNAEILNYQVDAFRKVMDENLHNSGRRIVFIHGKGEGVLRQALLKELNYRYKECSVQDASFREYGYGATQVTIAHNFKQAHR